MPPNYFLFFVCYYIYIGGGAQIENLIARKVSASKFTGKHVCLLRDLSKREWMCPKVLGENFRHNQPRS